MIGNLARIPETTRQRLHQHPEQISSFLYPGSPQPAPQPGFLARLFGAKRAEQPSGQTVAETLPVTDTLDIDKTWHALHFLFTGSNWEGEFPAGFLLAHGEPVGEEDVGYGPARSFTPAEVKQIATFLDAQNEATLRGRLNPSKMSELEIYPSIWDRNPFPEEEWEYFVDGFRRMKQFVRETASREMALLIYLN